MIKNKDKINNEYYVGNSINHLIKDNYVVLPFEVDQYICLGTLKDLEVYNFGQTISMIKSKSAILKSLGNWDYDEISVQDPNSEAAVIKVIQCGICSTDVIRSMEVGFYNYRLFQVMRLLEEYLNLETINLL